MSENDKLIVIFDTETTGFPLWNKPSDDKGQPHIVQLCALLVDPSDRRIVSSMNLITKPEGWEIPDKVVEIHGITTAFAAQVGIPERRVVALFLQLWSGRKVVAHNINFDKRIIRIGAKRFCDDAAEKWKATESECTMLQSKPIMKMEPKNNFGYKPPKLSEAYEYFTDRELVGAHNAAADTRACMDVYFAMQDLASKEAEA